MRHLLIGLLAVLTASMGCDGAPAAVPRIQSVIYDPDNVVMLAAADGYALVVELSDDERIDNIVVGNSAVWQVAANKRGDRIVIKPLPGAIPTDMVVTTEARRYVFTLQPASNAEAVPFVIRFTYQQPAGATVATGRAEATYILRGAKVLFPITMSDDGQRTTIRWARDTRLPAIFAIDDQDKQAIVNGRMVDGDYVIEGVARTYLLQRDKARAVAVRKPIREGRR